MRRVRPFIEKLAVYNSHVPLPLSLHMHLACIVMVVGCCVRVPFVVPVDSVPLFPCTLLLQKVLKLGNPPLLCCAHVQHM